MPTLIENPYYRPPAGATTPEPLVPINLGYGPGPYQVVQPRGADKPIGIVSAPFTSPAEYRVPSYGDIQRNREPLSEREYELELRYLAGAAGEFEERLGTLNQLSEKMDPIAKSRMNELNRKSNALQQAFSNGKINQLELFRAMNLLKRNADDYNWDAHVKGPGSSPGDIWEKDGYIMQNVPGKGPTPVDYTNEYRKANTYIDNENGFVVIPTAPGKESRILHKSEYASDDATVKGQEANLRRAVDNQVRLLADIYKDPITGALSKPIEEIRAEAVKYAVETESQIRRAAAKAYGRESELTPHEQNRTVEDESLDQSDLWKKVRDQDERVRKARLQTEARRASMEAAEFARTPRGQWELNNMFTPAGMETTPPPSPAAQLVPQTPESAQQMYEADSRLVKALASAGDDEEKQTEARVENWQDDPLLASMVNNPISLRSKRETQFAPDNRVYLMPDSKNNWKLTRFFKYKGKFYKIPWEERSAEAERKEETSQLPPMNEQTRKAMWETHGIQL